MDHDIISLPMSAARAVLEPSSLNEEARTVEVVWTTGARGRRSGWSGSYFEELAIEPENVRTERLVGAAVLDQHRGYSIRDAIGVVESVRSVKSPNGKTREWRAVIRFSSQAEDVLTQVREGIVRHVSVGYLVNRYEELQEKQDNLPVYRAVDWEPLEISFVNIPFDAKAAVRSSELTSQCTLVPLSRSENMKKNHPPVIDPAPSPELPASADRQGDPAPASLVPAPAPAVPDPESVRAETRQQLLADIDTVRRLAVPLRLTAEQTDGFVRQLGEGKTLDQVRAAMLETAAARQEKIDPTCSRTTVGTNLEVDGIERGISEVLLARALPSQYASQVTETGRRFQRDSVLRMAERLLEAHGRSIDGLSSQRVITEACKFRSGSHSTSDFFWLFESTVDRILKDEFNKVRLTYLPLATNVELRDFRPSQYVVTGDSFSLTEQKENEELTYGTFTADARSFRLATFSRGIVWSRQMMINDDLSVLSRLPGMVNRAGDKLKARMVWSMIVGDRQKIGPNGIGMSDGNPLFSSVHGNLAASGGGINKTTVAEARKAIRRQKAFGGEQEEDTLDLEPKFLICGPEREQEAIEFLAANFVAVNQADAAALNLSRSLTLIVENRITDKSWYLASPDIDGIVTATLQGEQGMFLDTDQDFETDGFKLKGRMEFGVHMARWEGWYKNPGA